METTNKLKILSDCDYCNDVNCQNTLTILHEISLTKLQLMVNAFFNGGPVPPPKIFPADEILIPLTNADCLQELINVSPDYTDVTNNQDIPFSIEKALKTAYSIAFFRGIFSMYSPYEFHFFKATGLSGNTVAFKAIYGNGSVYCGDLSGLP